MQFFFPESVNYTIINVATLYSEMCGLEKFVLKKNVHFFVVVGVSLKHVKELAYEHSVY